MTSVRTLSNLEYHCDLMPKILGFETSKIGGFFMFGVLNAKNLAFGRPTANGL